MKKFLEIMVPGLLLSGCVYSSIDYEKGYEDAWKGYSPNNNSSFYLDGY
jgi:hypothetical protein